MRKILALSIIALLGCAAGRPIADVSTEHGDLRCELLPLMGEEAKEASKSLKPFKDGDELCEPIETMVCNNIEYAISYKCPDMDKPVSIFKY